MPKAIKLACGFLYTFLLAAGTVVPLHAQQRQDRPPLDVPFVPTNQPTVEAMLRIANVGPNDFVIDGDFAHRLRFEDRVSGNTMEGAVRGDGTAPRCEQKWRASRASP